MGPGNQDTGTLGRILYFHHIYLNALGGIEGLPFDHLILIEHGIHLAQVHTDILANIPLYNTGHHIFFLLVVLIVQGFSLFLPDFLQNHVLGILGGNTAELFGFHFHVDNIADLVFGIPHSGVRQTDLQGRILHIFHNLSLGKHGEVPGFRIDVYLYIVRLAEMIFAGLEQRLLNGFQQSLFADIFFLFQNVQCFDQFCVHFS